VEILVDQRVLDPRPHGLMLWRGDPDLAQLFALISQLEAIVHARRQLVPLNQRAQFEHL
jgi:hypothetical protein